MWTEERISVGKLTLNLATSTGAESPLLLLHGVLRDWRDWASVGPALLPRWQLLALDQRGHGRSDPADSYFVADYFRDALTLIGEHCSEKVVVWGHSLGALVAVALAGTIPNRVRAVILEDPPAAPFLRNVAGTPWHAVWEGMRPLASSGLDTATISQKLAEVRQPTGGGLIRLGDLRDGASLRYSARCLGRVDPLVFDALLNGRWLDGFDLDALARRVECPALLMRGDPRQGGMLDRKEAERLAGLMREGLLVDIPGAGHLIHATASEALLRVVLPFLESLD